MPEIIRISFVINSLNIKAVFERRQRNLANNPTLPFFLVSFREGILAIQGRKMNQSSNATTSLPTATAMSLLPWFIAFGTEALVIFGGNLVTIFAFATKVKSTKKSKFLLLINLSIADLLVGAIPLPLYLAYLGGELDYWEIDWGQSLEIAMFGVDILLGFASVMTLTVISLERVYATVVPVGYRGLQPRNYWFSIAFIWFVAASTTAVCLAGNFVLKSLEIATYVSMSLLSVLCSVISVSYITIWRRIKAKRRYVGKKTNEYENKLALTLFIVTVTSLAAWLPFVIVNVLFVFSSFRISFNFIYFTKVLHYGNSFVNPIVYSLRMPEFRQSVVRMFSLRSSDRCRLPVHQLSNLCTATEVGQSTFRSHRGTGHGQDNGDSDCRKTMVTWKKSSENHEISVLLPDDNGEEQ